MSSDMVTLPTVVHLGFAGSRLLFDPTHYPGVDAEAFQVAVQSHLTDRLRQLPEELGMPPEAFLCGISQMAAGGDFLFTRACGIRGIPQRVFLSQHRAEYLSASGSDATPDFSDAERAEAEGLLESPHLIQERVVSDALEREARFEEVNLEIVRLSDLVLCLIRDAAPSGVGGTIDLLERAEHRGKPSLEIRVSVQGDRPRFVERWHRRETFLLPELPESLAHTEVHRSDVGDALPSVQDYCDTLRAVAGKKASHLQARFTYAAAIIILTHAIATLATVIGLKFTAWWSVTVLGGEVFLLVGGLAMHEYLHHSRSTRTWALSRLVVEISRTFSATASVHTSLNFLFHLPMPALLHPLLHTLNVLHLRSTRPEAGDPWEPKRDAYVDAHLAGTAGQIQYYTHALPRARRSLACFRRAFLAFSILGILATGGKLAALVYDMEGGAVDTERLAGILGMLAILMPVFAVAALSLASSRDLEARVHTYEEMLDFLNVQLEQLNSATSEREFVRLMLETESRLLGETANWYSRRSFTGVA